MTGKLDNVAPGTGAALVDSHYEATVKRKPFGPPPNGDLDTDVCVVGGGFTGISAALNLAEWGHKVTLLEAAKVGWGASGRNGGQCSVGFSRDSFNRIAWELDAVMSSRDLWNLSVEAVQIVRNRIRRHAIDCDFRDGHILAAVKGRHVDELKSHYRDQRSDFHFRTEYLTRERVREAVGSDRYLAGILDTHSGHLHPLKYLLGLADAARQAGVQIHEDTRVTAFFPSSPPWVHTTAGVVRCRKAVLACNAYLDGLNPFMRERIMPISSHICATRPLDREQADALIPSGACVSDMCHILDYYRMSADDRLLFGARLRRSPDDPSAIASGMRKRIAKVFPTLADVPFDHIWSGHVAVTRDRFPDLGWIGEDVLYAQGFSGHGVALSGFSGRLIAEAIDGDPTRFRQIAAHRARRFPGGEAMRAPLAALAMFWYTLRDLL